MHIWEPRTNQRIPNIDRARLLAAHTNGEDFLETARLLGIKRSTAYSIIRSGRPAKLPTGGARQAHIKVDQEICNFVAELLESNALLTLLEINHRIRTRFPHKREFSKSTLSKKLDGLLFTTKLVRDVPAERNRSDVIQARIEYATWWCSPAVINANKIYVDEMGFNIWTRRSHVSFSIAIVRKIHSKMCIS